MVSVMTSPMSAALPFLKIYMCLLLPETSLLLNGAMFLLVFEISLQLAKSATLSLVSGVFLSLMPATYALVLGRQVPRVSVMNLYVSWIEHLVFCPYLHP
jgi:hypothetical protein